MLSKRNAIFLSCLLYGQAGLASTDALILNYEEVEEEVGILPMRYLITDSYLRIDAGVAESDYVLFDADANVVYSVNHEDRTILNIPYKKWKQPALEFSYTEVTEKQADAPQIDGRSVYEYKLDAGDETCTHAFVVKGVFATQMKVFHAYQQVLSGQQVSALPNTPDEFHTPCFLLDQVYQQGNYYLQGLPVQVTHSRGYARYLKNYKQQAVDDVLFDLPEDYKDYFPFGSN